MPRDLILGTAGHIDHGKTSLVQALTGIDCDRLPEEKQRGITIDIGFASLDLGEFHLGIIDVPGHERFIKNMLAGSTGIDLALFVVAADDSIMPQTREHLEILSLLGIQHGVIALTKCDLVDETTRDVVTMELRELVAKTFLESAVIVPVSSKTAEGIDQLKDELRRVCRQVESKSVNERFRMAIDRAFVVQGHGTVVTGSVAAGTIKIGDELDWYKHDGTVQTVRVRGLNQHGKTVETVHRGQRAAINLANVPFEDVHRGQVLASPGSLKPSRIVTIRLLALPSAHHAIKHRLPCRLHIGTAEVMATISLLDSDRVEPGKWAFAQLFLEESITAVWGQPFVIRDSSAEHTIGGGQILQPTAMKLRRRHLEAIVRVEALWSQDERIRAAAAVWLAGFAGIQPDELIRSARISIDSLTAVVKSLLESKSIIEETGTLCLLHAERVEEAEKHILSTLAALHAEFPLLTTHDRGKIISRLDFIGDESILAMLMNRMLQTKRLVGDGKRFARPDFKPKLSANQRKIKDRIVADYVNAGMNPPDIGGYLNLTAGNAKALNEIFEVAVAEGVLVKLSNELFLAAEAEIELKRKVRELLANDGATVAVIRDVLGTTRKFAVPFCEYLDRIGVTIRDGDLRILATDVPN